MSKGYLFIFLWLFLSSAKSFSCQGNLSYSGMFSLLFAEAVPLRVYVFLGTECPLSQNYTLTLKQLQKKYDGKSVDFIGVFPAEDDNEKKIKAFVNQYGFPFRFVRDIGQRLTHRYQVTVTPQVILVNEQDEILYSGKIDDWVVVLGKKKEVPTEHYLNEAIQAGMAGLEVKVKQTTPIGCLIELKPSASHKH
jgi:thiol-disulfide isomerase/thioredoxin